VVNSWGAVILALVKYDRTATTVPTNRPAQSVKMNPRDTTGVKALLPVDRTIVDCSPAIVF